MTAGGSLPVHLNMCRGLDLEEGNVFMRVLGRVGASRRAGSAR
jgi:hypothetical protein